MNAASTESAHPTVRAISSIDALATRAKVGVVAGDTASYFGNLSLVLDGWSSSTAIATRY